MPKPKWGRDLNPEAETAACPYAILQLCRHQQLCLLTCSICNVSTVNRLNIFPLKSWKRDPECPNLLPFWHGLGYVLGMPRASVFVILKENTLSNSFWLRFVLYIRSPFLPLYFASFFKFFFFLKETISSVMV